MSEQEKQALRPYFLTKRAWRNHIQRVLQTAAEIEVNTCPFPQRTPTPCVDFMQGKLCLVSGTARRRKLRRQIKREKKG